MRGTYFKTESAEYNMFQMVSWHKKTTSSNGNMGDRAKLLSCQVAVCQTEVFLNSKTLRMSLRNSRNVHHMLHGYKSVVCVCVPLSQ